MGEPRVVERNPAWRCRRCGDRIAAEDYAALETAYDQHVKQTHDADRTVREGAHGRPP